MFDEWQTDRLDLASYLARIGYSEVPEPSERALFALHRAHVATVPFENLDIVLGRGVSVDLDSVQDKLVHRRRGGYCYEHGVLFAAALQRLGYTVDRLLARIGDDPDRPRPRTHMTLRVRMGADEWLADVGFGAGLLEPLPWDNSGTVRWQGSWRYRLLPGSGGAAQWQVREQANDEDNVLYSFTEEPQHASDIEMANHYTATHPSSPFVGQLVAIRNDEHTRRRLIGRRLTVTRPGKPDEQQDLTDTEIVTALRNDFEIALADDDVAAVTAPDSRT